MKSDERPPKPSRSRAASARATRTGAKRRPVAGSDPRIGKVLGPYEIKAILGRGGMGIVYLAEHKRLGRDVALKVMSPELSNDDEFRKRFERESTLAAHLDHPNIVQVHDAGISRGLLYLAMQLVSGKDLRVVLDEEGALSPERSVSIISQIAGGLDEAHAEGLIHRDLKPANILLTKRRRGGEHAFLTDFGLAKRSLSASRLTRTGYYVGTMSYSAPEQFEGKVVDARADIYSLGCVLFECLTGRPPFDREQELAVIYAHLHEEPPSASDIRPGLPAELDVVLHRAMAKDPDHRFADCGELVARLQSVNLSPVPPAPATAADGNGHGPGAAAPAIGAPGPDATTVPPPPPPPPPPAPGLPPAPRSIPRTPGPDETTDVRVPVPQTDPAQMRPASVPAAGKPARKRALIAASAAAVALIAAVSGYMLLRDTSSPASGSNGPTLSAAFESSCAGLRCEFAPAGDVAGLETTWDFGDGSAGSTKATPTHVYESVGDYQVTLHLADASGGSADHRLALAVTLTEAERRVSFSLAPEAGRLTVSGTVGSSEPACVDDVQVVVERRGANGWAGSGRPIDVGGNGRYEGTIPDDPGTYRASVPGNDTEAAACGGATSSTKKRVAPAASAPSSGTTDAPSGGAPSSGGDEGGDDVFGGGGGGGGGDGGDDVFGDSGGGGGGGGGCSGLC